ncbi:hypothetical protein ACWDSD_40830 [Streptomyces spiralis]
MSRTFVRRAATAVASLGIAAVSLLVAGGSASAATEPTSHPAAVVTHEGGSHGERADRHDGDDRRHGNGRQEDGRWWGQYREHDHRWSGHREHDSRWDGYRWWERSGHDWYSYDHDHRYRYDGHRLYRWNDDAWVIWNVGGHFDVRVLD